MSSTIHMPSTMEIGSGAITKLASILNNLGCERPCFITDKVMVELGYVDKVALSLKQANIKFSIFDQVEPEPSDQSLIPAIRQVKQDKADCLVALGGGSAIDSAKAIAILAKFGGDISDYKVPTMVEQKGLPLIAIPTTAGTGSEVTKATVITNKTTDEKMLCMGHGLVPTAAIIDYELTLSCPPRTTADTGIDALTHAIEAYVSKKASPYTDQQALTAIRLIAPNLRTAYSDPANEPAREAMMLGATLAGIAFSNASVALVHGMSRPIGAHFHVPHGLSNAMLLPSVTRYSLVGNPQRYADIARAMAVATTEDTIEQANIALIEELIEINGQLNVPSLAEFGVNKENFNQLLELMAEQALASGSPANNPLVPDKQSIINLYKQLW